MLKFLAISTMSLFLATAPAMAGQTCDEEGNCYFTLHSGSGTHVRGNNLNTGSTWNTEIGNNGDMSGQDSKGRTWNYERKSGAYLRSDGRSCFGHGSTRFCN